MRGKAKVLGCAVAALAMVGALGASGAQAQNSFDFTVSGPHITGTSLNAQIFSFAGLTIVTCEHLHLTVSPDPIGQSADELMSDPQYSGCSFEGLNADVRFAENECSYTFYATEGADLSCPTGEKAEIAVTLFGGTVCRIDITPSLDTTSTGTLDTSVGEGGRTHPKTAVSYANNEGRVDVDTEATGLTYHTTGSFCPEPEATANDGAISGSAALEADEGEISVT